MNLSHRTAMIRKSPSAPMRYLASTDRLEGIALDYGCGRGFDADFYGMQGYDPHHRPSELGDSYDTVTCNFVLNTLEHRQDRIEVLIRIKSLLSLHGVAFITVRTDRANLKGRTSTGTWQGDVTADLAHLACIHKGKGFAIYAMSRKDPVFI